MCGHGQVDFVVPHSGGFGAAAVPVPRGGISCEGLELGEFLGNQRMGYGFFMGVSWGFMGTQDMKPDLLKAN